MHCDFECFYISIFDFMFSIMDSLTFHIVGLKCSVWGIEKNKFENCSKPYEKINSTDGEACR